MKNTSLQQQKRGRCNSNLASLQEIGKITPLSKQWLESETSSPICVSLLPIALLSCFSRPAPSLMSDFQTHLLYIPPTSPLFYCFSGGRAIGPGGATQRVAVSRGGADVTIEGRRGQQYLMNQGGERISSGKSSIFNGVKVGKEVRCVCEGTGSPYAIAHHNPALSISMYYSFCHGNISSK